MPGKFHQRYGWKRQAPDPRDHRYTVPPAIAAELPTKVNFNDPPLAAPFNPSIDQGNLGSCGPNAMCNMVVFEEFDEKVSPAVLSSRLFLYYNTRLLMGTVNQDSGVDNRTMLKALAQYGWCDEKVWPYNINQFRTKPSAAAYTAAAGNIAKLKYEAVDQVLETMKGAIADRKGILFGFDVYESFESAQTEKTGDVPMPGPRESILGGHDVLLTGYDDAAQRFNFRNSWGASWGNQGSGTFPYAFATNPKYASDFWTIDAITDVPIPPPPPPPPGPPPPDGQSYLTLAVDMKAGQYFLMPVPTAALEKLTPMQLMQIVLLIVTTLTSGPITQATLMALVLQIAAILGIKAPQPVQVVIPRKR